MRVTRRRLVLISDRANDVPLPGSRAANTQVANIYAFCQESRRESQPASAAPVYGNLFSAATHADLLTK